MVQPGTSGVLVRVQNVAKRFRNTLALDNVSLSVRGGEILGLIAADLGGCKLVKQEDAGVLFYEDEVKLPDWRLTLLPDKNILVEVKAEDGNHPRVSKLRLAEVARLKSYAELNDCPLYIAVHWVVMGMWTLVPIDDYVRVGDHFEIDLWDQEGDPVGRLAGVELRPTSLASLRPTVVDAAQDLYQVSWQPVTAGSRSGLSGTWAVVADDAVLVTVANVETYRDFLPLTPSASPIDGRFDVFVVPGPASSGWPGGSSA